MVLLHCHGDSSQGRAQLPASLHSRRGEERGCWNCSFPRFFFLCCDLDEQSLKRSPAIFFCLCWKTSGCSRAVQRKSRLLGCSPQSLPRGRGGVRGRARGRPCGGRCSSRDWLSLNVDAVVSPLKKAQPSAWGQILFSAWRSDLIFHVPYLKKHKSLAGLKEREKTNKRLRCIFAPAGPTCAAVFGVRLPGQNVDLILNPYDSANSVYGRFSF